MRVLFASSEAVPFAKTGGLADVSAALPRALAKAGVETTLILPAYRQALAAGLPIEPTGITFEVPIGTKMVAGTYLRSQLPGSQVPVILVQCDPYFGRAALYGERGQDYRDNCERFTFFSRAVMESIHLLDLNIDILHCNDWQTGLIPAFLKIEAAGLPRYDHIASVMTIHNLAYQGNFWHWDMLLTGLDWKYFNWHQMEFFGNLNLLKTGIVFADRLSTVSPRYAQEIQSPLQGCGLEGVLQQRRDVLSGILNGVDYDEWSPAIDANLVQKFGATNYREGKAACKAALQQAVGLPVSSDPLFAFVGRLASQKGVDLLVKGLHQWLPTRAAQWVFLGTGDPAYHDALTALSQAHPHRLAVKLAFSDSLAHQIEAGADMFLMPSQYEPCGLNQMYSLKYGTVPIVRKTGGLADTIVDADATTINNRTANGFVFQEQSAIALGEAIDRALTTFAMPATWEQLVTTGMQQDWSWSRSAHDYLRLYEQTLAQARPTLLA